MLQIYKIIRDKQVNFIKKMMENEIGIQLMRRAWVKTNPKQTI